MASRISLWHLSFAAIAFGSGGAAVLGGLMLIILCLLLLCAGTFYGLQRICRYFFPQKNIPNECPPEVLDYWAEWRRQNPTKLTPSSP